MRKKYTQVDWNYVYCIIAEITNPTIFLDPEFIINDKEEAFYESENINLFFVIVCTFFYWVREGTK